MTRLGRAIRSEVDLFRSRRVDTRELRTVCVALGPYRNLTTITAAMVALHPHCQVLNHAGARILNRRRLDFFRYPDSTTFDAFTRYAIHISRAGRRGDFGGSITLSHAFANSPKLREQYRAAYGTSLVKDVIHSMFWKESLAVANHIREHDVDVGRLLDDHARLRFLLPVRHPLDCAASNLKTGHVARFGGLDAQAPIERVVLAILDEFGWFLELQNRHPDRFFSFFAHECTALTLRNLAKFLEVEADEQWCEQAVEVFRSEGQYDHAHALCAFYANAVREQFSGSPEFRDKLLRYVQETPQRYAL
jgi:hypothetical protein